MSRRRDVVVIGAGHNGLTHAAYLAKAGLDVEVVEAAERIGGATATDEVEPGFLFSTFSYLVSLLRPEVIHELDLVRHGLRLVPLDSTLNPLPDGDEIYREADRGRTYRNLARHSKRDAEAYFDYKLRMTQVARAAHRLQETLASPELARELAAPASDAGSEDQVADALSLLGAELLDLPTPQLVSLVQMFTMSAADFLAQWFETDALLAALSTSSIIGSFVSPRSPGSAYVLLHHYMGEVDGVYRAWGFQPGGTGEVAQVLARAAREAGATIRTDAPVEGLLIGERGVEGVRLRGGEEIRAAAVSSSLDPRTSLLRLPGDGAGPWLGEVERRRLESWRSDGCSAKVNLALSRPPSFACRPGRGAHLAGGISIAPSVDYVEQAYDEARAGRPSSRPFIDLVVPSEIDPGMAPPGAAVVSCFVQYVPRRLAEGEWSDALRDEVGDAVMAALEEYAPGIGESVVRRQVLTPADIESRVGIAGGNIFHGELRLSQLFLNRPLPGASEFRTQLPGYYLCGSGCHPGGGISGAPGRFAALRLADDLRAAREAASTAEEER